MENKEGIKAIHFKFKMYYHLSNMSEKAVPNFSHGWSDHAYANVVNNEVQVEAEDPLTGGSPSIHGTTPSKLLAGDDTTMSRFGHYSIFSGCLSIGNKIICLPQSA